MDTSQEPNRFTLTIRLGNATMQTPRDVASALEQSSWDMTTGDAETSGIIRDDYGNRVGRWEFTTDEEENR